MSDFNANFWHLYVAGITLVGILACLILLWFSGKAKAMTANDNTTGHVWDGDLREMNNPLPRWWVGLFIITVIFSLVYLAFYPGLGNLPGKFGWSSAGQYDAEVAKATAQEAPLYAKFQGMPPEQVSKDAQAMAIGDRLFMNNCAQCHGSDARGSKGFPNLTDGDWLHGGSPDKIKLVKSVRPRIMGNTGETVTLKIGSQDDPWSEPVYTSMTHTIGSTVRNNCLVAGRYISFKVETGSAYTWRMDSYDIEVETIGDW